jgi:putative intracellular protease/amidase
LQGCSPAYASSRAELFGRTGSSRVGACSCSIAIGYSLDEELKKRGAKYSKASIPFKSYVVEDGLLITGQNPESTKAVGEAVVKRPKKAK